jgi:hypothetical protein
MITVDFTQYCPSLSTFFQLNLVLLDHGFIHGIQLLKHSDTNEYRLAIQRKIPIENEKHE